jgi:hypothetical protein
MKLLLFLLICFPLTSCYTANNNTPYNFDLFGISQERDEKLLVKYAKSPKKKKGGRLSIDSVNLKTTYEKTDSLDSNIDIKINRILFKVKLFEF